MTDVHQPVVAYAGFWRRVAAALVDQMFFFAVTALLLYFVKGPAYLRALMFADDELMQAGIAELLVEQLVPAIITIGMWLRFGATPGKFLFGCRVVDAQTRGSLTLRQSVLRYVGYFLSLLPLGLGFLWVAIDKRRQGFHDKLAHTQVIIEDEASLRLEQLQHKAGV